MAKKQAPAAPSSTGWIIAAIAVIVIIAFFVMRPGKVDVMEKKEAAPSEQIAPGGLAPSEAPAMEKKCTIAIGIVPGTKSVKDNVVTVTFKNNGRVEMEGTYFAFSDEAGKAVYRKNPDAVEPGKTMTYTVDLNQVATELGSAVKSFVVFPIQDGKACENQRSIVISDTGMFQQTIG